MSTTLIAPAAPPEQRSPSAKCVVFQDQIEIPLGIDSLDDFRQWARSDAFPTEGRIDYIDGRIEVDLMVENLFFHGSPKSEISRTIANRIHTNRLGRLFIDKTRISSTLADMSAEPDVLFLAFDSIQAGRVRFIPASDGDPDSFVEIEGSPDWVCE
ncbi:MAG: Uma2 family endonuclease, partial [Planctomycetaceae bacterium]|nr:Uma2 family endonuclease [Planctomycetaceae bacterium]